MQQKKSAVWHVTALAIAMAVWGGNGRVSAQLPQLVPINPQPGATYNGYANNGPVYHTAGLGTVQVPTASVPQMPAGVNGFPIQNAGTGGYTGGAYAPPVYYVAQAPPLYPQVPGPQPGVYVPQNYVTPAAQPYPVWNPYPTGYAGQPQNLWDAQINALYMTRSKESSFPLLLDGGGATLVNADQLDFGWQWGFDVGLSRKLGAYQNFELRYFQISPWTAQLSSPFVAGDALATNPPTTIFAMGTVDYLYRSSVYSFELNLVSRLMATDRVRLALGFRWMELSENLTQSFTPSGTALVVDTNNHLYGLQIAGDGVLINANRFSVVTWVKGGIYANVADQSTDFTGGPVISNGARATTAAFVGETGLMGDFAITQCVSIIGGYQLLWVSGAALAADQIPNMGTGLGGFVPTGLDQSDLYYHGAIFGLDFRW